MPRPAGSFRMSRFVLAVLGIVAAATPAQATQQRSFVKSTGSDLNNCTLAFPCRSFNAAIAQTLGGGEVVILDTAGYGPMVIDKSIKIIGPSGVYGGISVLGGAGAPPPPTTGVVINAGATDVITLRGLDIAGVPTVAPLPLYGIDIQNAGAVHIEKSSISNFAQTTSACIRLAPTTGTRVYVNDSFLRECRTGIDANGTAVSGDGPGVIVDNTRIERGSATSGPAWGLWVHGNIGVGIRNSVITDQDVGIQMDDISTDGGTVFALSQTQLAGMATGLNVVSAVAGAVPFVNITGSHFVGVDNGIIFSHTAAGTPYIAQLKIADSSFELLPNAGITISTAADARIDVDFVRSQMSFFGTGISAAASGTSQLFLNLRDSTLASGTTLLKTSGTSTTLHATLVRSHLHNSVTAVDHGRGRITMEQTNVSVNQKSLVNNGSPTILSAGNNFIVDNVDPTDGTVYIAPTNVGTK